MKIYISHALEDRKLASSLAKQLKEAGFKVLNPWDRIYPGDNWGKIFGQALEKANAMIILITPDAVKSQTVKMDIMHAIGELRFENKVLSVAIGKGKPWGILTKLPQVRLKDSQSWDAVVEKLAELPAPILA